MQIKVKAKVGRGSALRRGGTAPDRHACAPLSAQTEPRLRSVTVVAAFFRVVAQGRSYVALLYALARLPLALAYLAILVIGLSIGFSILVVGIGAVVLLLMLFAIRF